MYLLAILASFLFHFSYCSCCCFCCCKGQLSTTHEKQLLFCFHSGYVGMGWFIPGVDIKRRAKGFKASSLKKYEDPPPCPPSLSQRPELKPEGKLAKHPIITDHPQEKQCRKHKRAHLMVSLQRGSFVILLRAPQSCCKLETYYHSSKGALNLHSLRGSAQDECSLSGLKPCSDIFNVCQCLWHHHFHIETHLPPAAKCEIKPFSSLGRG